MKKLTIGFFAILLPVGLGSLTERPSGGNSSRLSSCSPKAFTGFSEQHLIAHPRIRVDDLSGELGTSSSVNWSGYADTATPAAADTVQTVTGTWTVPAVKSTAGTGVAAYSAVWVGIDGFDDGTVEQLGTLQAAEVVSSHHGKTTTATLYEAWVEMYPAPMVVLPGVVNPGDVITASVTWVSGGICTLYMNNATEGWVYGPINVAGSTTAADMSAEWVVEAPSSGSGVLPLADFGTVSFTDCSTTIGSSTPGIEGPIDDGSFIWDSMTMITGGRRSTDKAVPSGLTDANGSSSFNVTWRHD